MLKKLPPETLDLLTKHFDIDPYPNGWGIWIFRGEKFIKVATGEVYVVEMAFFNKIKEVRNNVDIPIGWRYVFRHLGTKKRTDVSSETLRTLFKNGTLARASSDSWSATEEVVKIQDVLTTIDFKEISGLRMNYGKSVITDLAKFISCHAIGLHSKSPVVFRNSCDHLIALFKTLHAWPEK